ncbi:ABC-type nitrate/sulfonate/bicarbonate transport system, permease component [Clostridium pasteurianum DSM 525 = ATCC 6013]|uniref:ABC-type nitrate/sulfonate/bicarbonate transport system, permease component n=1 Tax=Clostridium pasteurianum DSM 525 = ATCC 6013 TaxID=1262449 RepID=A0A0H3J8N0_CLOPA|nr:ABC transporter permease [Clostridium pasteurianum]AJA49582.1 ABC-type nitrate/sulfonate/bicarbonate transport system, permease component [Clostridium pasteurianum DSM 525 = ATCC 6013]AJA53570.1 ABC-type nitrate/sulfonate/bicarbonate transport system, permease component [Clostridium pasteurianum DSM 525 = ATCC 6013]KRU14405.1 ABC-type transporter, integral membrane subunit [Clostridium pasteurianum DSM 525 = ATCC 6013]UZW13855.1 ABC transporter permease [Clostridium pasteurianum]
MVYKIGVDVLGVWKPYTFPSPVDVFRTLVSLVEDNTLFIGIAVSLRRLALGYIISLIIGIALGLLIVRYKYLDENFSSLILGLQTLPSICWLPFAVLWYGINEKSIIFVIAIGSIFAISIATESGIKNVNPIYIKAGETMGAKGIKLYWNVVLPSALPSIITGMKQGWSFAWRALIAGEMLSATRGLGQILMLGRDLADISQVMSVMLIIIVIGLIIDKLIFGTLEKNIRQRCGLDR